MINGSDAVVIAAGVAAIAWVNWYFFVAGRSTSRPREISGAEQQDDTTPRAE